MITGVFHTGHSWPFLLKLVPVLVEQSPMASTPWAYGPKGQAPFARCSHIWQTRGKTYVKSNIEGFIIAALETGSVDNIYGNIVWN